MGRNQTAFHPSRAHPGSRQHTGILAESVNHSSWGVVSTEEGVHHDIKSFRSPSGGPICGIRQSAGPQVFLKVLPSSSRRHGRTDVGLASGPALCLSTDSQGDPKGHTAKSHGDHGGPVVAMQAVVLHATPPISGSGAAPTTRPEHASPRAHLPSSPSQASSDRLASERRSLLVLGLSQEVISTFLASRKGSTIRIYNSTWKVFHCWCSRHHKDPLSASVETILDFLQDGLKKNLRPVTLRCQVAALDSVISVHGVTTFAKHPLIQRFLKGSERISPPRIHRFPTWKLNVVLHALTKSPFEPLHEVGLKWVRLKTIFLVAIASARHISEFGAMSCDPSLCVFHRDKVVL